MAFLKVPLLTPKSRWISSGELLSLSGRLPPASSSRARICWLRLDGGLGADRLQAKGDLAVRAQFLDVALFAHAAAEELERLVLVDQAPVLALDDRLEAHLGTLHHQQVDRLADAVARRQVVQLPVQARGGGDAVGALVQVDVDHAVVADLQRTLLFRMRQQQVLGQAPVEEQADPVDLHDLQAGETADLDLGRLGGGDQAVVAVQVDEHVEPVTHFAGLVLRHIALGQEDLAVLGTVEIEPELRVLDHLQ